MWKLLKADLKYNFKNLTGIFIILVLFVSASIYFYLPVNNDGLRGFFSGFLSIALFIPQIVSSQEKRYRLFRILPIFPTQVAQQRIFTVLFEVISILFFLTIIGFSTSFTKNIALQKLFVIIGALATVFATLSGAILLVAGQLPKIVSSTVLLKTAWMTFGKKLMGIVGIITTLAGALIYLTSMQERESRKRKEFLLDYVNYLNKREKDAKLTINNAKTIKKLSGNVSENITKYNHLQHAIKEINKVNPGLIDQEKDITTQLDKVSTASKEASGELIKLAKSKEKLRQFDIADRLSDATAELDKLKNKIDSINFGDTLGSTFKSVTMQGLRTSKDVKAAFLKDMKNVGEGFDKVATKGMSTGMIIKRWQPDILGVKAYVEDLAKTEEGRSEERRVGKECRSRWSPYH